jgi:hypothetical protein
MDKIILLAGGSGLIGTKLAELLRLQHYTVRLLTRTPKGPGAFKWDPSTGEIDDNALQNVDTVVNLAGAGIADKRWTHARKREIIESRVLAARVLVNAFERTGVKPKAYIAASAIGIYGNSGEQIMSESSPSADHSFMVDCCRQWEAATDEVAKKGIRTVTLRIGVVLAREGGALAEIIKPLQLGLGAYFGNGQAWWSWIHREDVCSMFLWAIQQPTVEGVFNAVAPNPVRGVELVRATAKAMGKSAVFLPAPSLVLRLMLGEMSAVILNSNHVTASKSTNAGFQFLYPDLPKALASIFQRH